MLGLLLLGCIQIADDASVADTTMSAGVGLRGAATLDLQGGVALPWTSEITTDPGMELVAEEGSRPDDPTPNGTLFFEADAPGTYGFTLDLDGSTQTAPEVAGELGFVEIAGLALDTTGWAPEPALLSLDALYLESGVTLDRLSFVDPDGVPVEGSADLEEVVDEAAVLEPRPRVSGGQLILETGHVQTGPASVRLLDGTVLDLPRFEVVELPGGAGPGWTLDAEVWEEEDLTLLFQLWLGTPEGGPLLTNRTWGECVQEGGRVMELAALDGVSTADPGCAPIACLDAAEAPHTLTLCVGEACDTIDAPVRLAFDTDPRNPECPWQEG